jgi:hypothetical protein
MVAIKVVEEGGDWLKKVATLEGFKMPKGKKFGNCFNPRLDGGKRGTG